MILRAIKEFLSPKEIDEEKIECAIDEETIPCDTLEDVFFSPEAQGSWTGIPAPAYLEDDPWFGPAPERTEKQKDYMAVEMEWKIEEEKKRKESGAESDDIHQAMYDLATKSGATTIQLDPIGGSENFQGGSENVHR